MTLMACNRHLSKVEYLQKEKDSHRKPLIPGLSMAFWVGISGQPLTKSFDVSGNLKYWLLMTWRWNSTITCCIWFWVSINHGGSRSELQLTFFQSVIIKKSGRSEKFPSNRSQYKCNTFLIICQWKAENPFSECSRTTPVFLIFLLWKSFLMDYLSIY